MSEILEFVSPFNLHDCKRRLDHRTENATFWAWRGEMRTQVDITEIDPVTASFDIYKMPKSYLTPQLKIFITKVNGRLRAGKDGSTLVVYQLDVSKGEQIIFWFLYFVISSMVSNLIVIFARQSNLMWLGGGVAILVSLILLVIAYYYRKYGQRQLLAIVRHVLEDDAKL